MVFIHIPERTVLWLNEPNSESGYDVCTFKSVWHDTC